MWTSQTVLNAIANLKAVVTNDFAAINKRLDTIIMSQTSIDNAVTVVTGLLTDLATDNQAILDDLTAIQAKLANGEPVDTTALDATVARAADVQAGLDSAVASLSATASAA